MRFNIFPKATLVAAAVWSRNGSAQKYLGNVSITVNVNGYLPSFDESIVSICTVLYNAAKFRSWGHLGRQLRFHDLKILGRVNEVIPYRLSEVFFF